VVSVIVWPSERRQAEDFAHRVDGPGTVAAGPVGGVGLLEQPAPHQPAPTPLMAELRMVRLLRAVEPAELDPDAKAAMRRRLLAVAAVQGPGSEKDSQFALGLLAGALPLTHRRRVRLVAAGAGLAVVAGAVGAGISGSPEAPGSPLYDVKRKGEAARIGLTRSDTTKGTLSLEFAKNRLSEAERSELVGGDLASTLMDMDSQTTDGVALLGTIALMRHDPSPLATIDSFVAEQRATLDRLSVGASPSDRRRIELSRTLLDRIETRVSGWRSALRCNDYGSVDDLARDDLGPLPPACEPITPPGPGQIPNPPRSQPTPTGTRPHSISPSPTPSSSASASEGTSGSGSPSPTATPTESALTGGGSVNDSVGDMPPAAAQLEIAPVS
jgi:hypothetical protein